MKKVYFDNLDGIFVSPLGEDDCLIDFQGSRVVLSYDAMYELALKLAEIIQETDQRPSRELFS